MGVEPIHVQCHAQKSITVTSWEQYHLHPHNPLDAIKKCSRIDRKSHRVNEPLNYKIGLIQPVGW